MDDPMGLKDRLILALSHPLIRQPNQTEETASVAFGLAAALGQCRLFGVHLERDLEGELPNDLIEPSLAGLEREVRAALEEADPESIGQRWEELGEFPEREDLVASLIQRRVRVWAAFVAISDAIDNEWDVPEFIGRQDRLNAIGDVIEEYDSRLSHPKMMEWLATIAERPYLANMRSQLASEFSSPWFLVHGGLR